MFIHFVRLHAIYISNFAWFHFSVTTHHPLHAIWPDKEREIKMAYKEGTGGLPRSTSSASQYSEMDDEDEVERVCLKH